MKKKWIKLLNIILIATFIVAAFNIIKIYYDYDQADNVYDQIQNQYIAPIQKHDESSTTPTAESETEQAPTAPITVDFDSLLARNDDVVGWLYCPDTVINYPVVQGENNDQYLRRDLDGKYLHSGTLFADYRNDALGKDSNYIIYGHNMKNGTMFNILTKYKEQAYYDQHPVMYYLTPKGNYKLELFAGLVIKRDDKIYVPNPDQDNPEFWDEYKTNSTFHAEIEPEHDDMIVTLSTCSYEFDDARYILIGRLTPV